MVQKIPAKKISEFYRRITPCIIFYDNPNNPWNEQIKAKINLKLQRFPNVLCYMVSWTEYKERRSQLDEIESKKITYYKSGKEIKSTYNIDDQKAEEMFSEINALCSGSLSEPYNKIVKECMYRNYPKNTSKRKKTDHESEGPGPSKSTPFSQSRNIPQVFPSEISQKSIHGNSTPNFELNPQPIQKSYIPSQNIYHTSTNIIHKPTPIYPGSFHRLTKPHISTTPSPESDTLTYQHQLSFPRLFLPSQTPSRPHLSINTAQFRPTCSLSSSAVPLPHEVTGLRIPPKIHKSTRKHTQKSKNFNMNRNPPPFKEKVISPRRQAPSPKPTKHSPPIKPRRESNTPPVDITPFNKTMLHNSRPVFNTETKSNVFSIFDLIPVIPFDCSKVKLPKPYTNTVSVIMENPDHKKSEEKAGESSEAISGNSNNHQQILIFYKNQKMCSGKEVDDVSINTT